MQTIRITKADARAFLIRAFALESWQSLPDTESAIRALEFVQEDSIPICGRMHDLILWPRVAGYTPQSLADTLYGPAATAFEIHFPNLAALPREDYPYFVRRMQARQAEPGRWQGLFPEEEPVAAAFLEALDTLGPLSTRRHGNDSGHMLSGWGTRSTVISQVAEKLWLHGKLGIAHRKNFERYFDRLERVAPELAAWHAPDVSLPDPDEARRYLVRKRLKAKALFRPKRDELATLGEAAFCKVEIEGLTKPWYTLKEHAPFALPPASARSSLWPTPSPSFPPSSGGEGVPQNPPPPTPPPFPPRNVGLRGREGAGGRDAATLLAPLDPLVYDRQRNREIFDFDYTWEVYVPAEKRKWGYYVLPILHESQLVGRVDLKRDTKAGSLQVLSLTVEENVVLEAVAEPIAMRLRELAEFLGVSRVEVTGFCPANICKSIAL